MSALCPRYINIRRGQIICAFVGGWALCPWEILANATGFLSFMSGYTVFLGPIAGIMITDVSSLFFFCEGLGYLSSVWGLVLARASQKC